MVQNESSDLQKQSLFPFYWVPHWGTEAQGREHASASRGQSLRVRSLRRFQDAEPREPSAVKVGSFVSPCLSVPFPQTGRLRRGLRAAEGLGPAWCSGGTCGQALIRGSSVCKQVWAWRQGKALPKSPPCSRGPHRAPPARRRARAKQSVTSAILNALVLYPLTHGAPLLLSAPIA